jgi:beta-lactamase class A
MGTARRLLFAAGFCLLGHDAMAGTLDVSALQPALQRLAAPFDGRVGFCARLQAQQACIRGGEAFPLQSVMKLLVGVAVMRAVDQGRLHLDERVTLRTADISMNVQPIARKIHDNGGAYTTTIDALLEGAVIDSDSAATDYLIRRLGGVAAVQASLWRLKLDGIRIDRDERHLQTETTGLAWPGGMIMSMLLWSRKNVRRCRQENAGRPLNPICTMRAIRSRRKPWRCFSSAWAMARCCRAPRPVICWRSWHGRAPFPPV